MNKLTYTINRFFRLTKSAKTIGKDKPQKWYGRVNFWDDMAQTKKDISTCVKYHLDGYMIELAGIKCPNGEQWTDNWVKYVEERYKKILKLTRAAGLWLFVSVVNDNMGAGKYGDKSPRLEKAMRIAQQLALIVKKNGSKNVIVQPVAETQTKAGPKFEKYCEAELSNFLLVYNGCGGFPPYSSGMNFRAVHPSSVIRRCPSDSFVISDHGLIIRELANGTFDGSANSNKLNVWYSGIKSWGCPVMGYYAFLTKKHDKETIKLIGGLK